MFGSRRKLRARNTSLVGQVSRQKVTMNTKAHRSITVPAEHTLNGGASVVQQGSVYPPRTYAKYWWSLLAAASVIGLGISLFFIYHIALALSRV
jgi:hypothetical protein